jgi:hypothetical protein
MPYGKLSLKDRFLSWLVTGPVGRFVAFVLDVGALPVRTAFRRGN